MELETKNLIITNFTPDMAESVSKASRNADNRRFMPDEVFETAEVASGVIADLIDCYDSKEGPFVYPILLKKHGHIGHVEAVKIPDGWEIGYHIATEFCGQGYATEAVRTFLPVIMGIIGADRMYGICDAENFASRSVLEKSGFHLFFDGMGPYHGGEHHIRRYVFER